MGLPDLTMPDLERLAVVVGRAMGEGQAEVLLRAEQQLQATTPDSPLEAAANAVLALIPDWAQEAVNVPRPNATCMQAQLLHAALEYRKALKAAEEEGQ